MGRASQFVLALGMVMLFTGCQTVPYQGEARDVKRKPRDEGVVAIPAKFRDEDRARAEDRMASNCGAGQYKIMEEGEVAVGQKVEGTSKDTDRASTKAQVGSLFGIPLTSGEAGGKDTSSSSTTTAIKEWQISYKCMASADAPAKKKVVK